ncbi:flagellar biosynthetic protein FliQ [Tabrizicola sp.]|uniref:flagellar biosynthetic protein FliQ n=1 Tax=Tabrizicola sp. TaxID=2005166 RepID=UPI0035B4FA4C
MEAADVGQMVAEMVRVILIACGPVLVVATIVGLLIALGQALTSVQEATLTFVPKAAVILIGTVLSLPLIYSSLAGLTERVFALIRDGGL